MDLSIEVLRAEMSFKTLILNVVLSVIHGKPMKLKYVNLRISGKAQCIAYMDLL